MDYLDAAFAEVMDEDGLLVMARGLGKQKLIARFLRLHAETPGSLVFCLNMAGLADHQLLQDALLAQGMERHCLPRVVTNELTGSQRETLYKQVSNHYYSPFTL